MNNIAFYASIICLVLLAPLVYADEWRISGDDDNLELKQRDDFDYSNRYKGSREADGYTKLKNRTSGTTLKGYIEDDGYGYLKDEDGHRIRVRPD